MLQHGYLFAVTGEAKAVYAPAGRHIQHSLDRGLLVTAGFEQCLIGLLCPAREGSDQKAVLKMHIDLRKVQVYAAIAGFKVEGEGAFGMLLLQ